MRNFVNNVFSSSQEHATYRVFSFIAPSVRWSHVTVSLDGTAAATPERFVFRREVQVLRLAK